MKDSTFGITAEIIGTPCPEIATGSIYTTLHGGISPFTFQWSNQQSSKDIDQLFGGEYTITVTDSLGCKISETFTVPEGNFTVEVFDDASIEIGESVQLYTTSNRNLEDLSYQWSPAEQISCDCPDPLVTPYLTTVYELVATDTSGCMASDFVTINVKTEYNTYFPNAFSPNNDGNNDVFRALGDIDKVKNFKLFIYDRWNNKIFETYDVLSGWDGSYEKGVSPLDVFIYYSEVEFHSGHKKELKGSITIVQ